MYNVRWRCILYTPHMYISDVSSVQFKMYIVQVKQEKIYVSPKLLVRRTCWSSETYTFFLSDKWRRVIPPPSSPLGRDVIRELLLS